MHYVAVSLKYQHTADSNGAGLESIRPDVGEALLL